MIGSHSDAVEGSCHFICKVSPYKLCARKYDTQVNELFILQLMLGVFLLCIMYTHITIGIQ